MKIKGDNLCFTLYPYTDLILSLREFKMLTYSFSLGRFAIYVGSWLISSVQVVSMQIQQQEQSDLLAFQTGPKAPRPDVLQCPAAGGRSENLMFNFFAYTFLASVQVCFNENLVT